MLPLETGPEWMRIASLLNPPTYIVDAERALFAGTLGDPAVLWGLVAALVTAAAGLERRGPLDPRRHDLSTGL